MPYSKVVYGGKTLIDLTNVTVTAETLAEGVIALDAAGNEVVGTMPTLQTIMQAVYPVGAIYTSTVSTSPKTLFGFGTWERIQDQFLLAAGGTYSAGSTGGEAAHTLTTEEAPAHTHTRGTMNITGALTERPCSSSTEILRGKDGGAFLTTTKGDDLQWGVAVQTSGSTNHKNNLHEFDASRSWTGETSEVGGGVAHNNMPPYLAVYVWKRTE